MLQIMMQAKINSRPKIRTKKLHWTTKRIRKNLKSFREARGKTRPKKIIRFRYYFSLTESRFLGEVELTLNLIDKYFANSTVFDLSPWFTRILFGVGLRFLT